MAEPRFGKKKKPRFGNAAPQVFGSPTAQFARSGDRVVRVPVDTMGEDVRRPEAAADEALSRLFDKPKAYPSQEAEEHAVPGGQKEKNIDRALSGQVWQDLKTPEEKEADRVAGEQHRARQAAQDEEDLAGWAKEIILSPPSGAIDAAGSTPYAFGKGVQFFKHAAEDDYRRYFGTPLTQAEAEQRDREENARLEGPGSLGDVAQTVHEHVYQPQTDIGKGLYKAGAFALGGKPSASTLLAPTYREMALGYGADLMSNVALPMVGSELAGGAAEGTQYETAARILGGVTGNIAGGVSRGVGSPIDTIVRRSTKNVTPEQWAAGRRYSDLADRTGIRLTGPEIMSEATGGGSPLTIGQRFVESDPTTGGSIMGQYLARRAGDLEAAHGRITDDLGIPQSQAPAALGAEAVKKAEIAKGNAMDQRTAASAPDYAAANPTLIPEADLRPIVDAIDAEIAADTTGVKAISLGELRRRLVNQPATQGTPGTPRTAGPVDPKTGQPRYYTNAVPGTPGTPETLAPDIENISRASKYIRDTMETLDVSNNPNRAAYEGEAGARLTDYMGQLDRLMRRYSNSYANAQDTHAANTRTIVDPVVNGPVGTVAKSGGNTAAAGEGIWPANPRVGAAPEIASSLDNLANADPQGARVDPMTIPQLLRNIWETRFQKAMDPTQRQDQTFGGAKFANDIAGNVSKQQVLEAVFNSLANGPGLLPQVNDMLTAMRITGRRMPAGSSTEFNRTLSSDLEADPRFAAGETIMSLGTNIPRQFRDWGKRVSKRAHVAQLADLFTDPRSVQKMQQIVARGPNTVIPEMTGRAALQSLNLLFGNSQPDQEPVP